MLRKTRERINAGDLFIKCCHVALGVLNPKVYVFDLTTRAFDQVRQIEHGHQAKWIILCETCANSNHGETGFPYTMHRMPVELNLGA